MKKFIAKNQTTSVARTLNEFAKQCTVEKVIIWQIEDVFYIEENQTEPECKRTHILNNWKQVFRFMEDHKANFVNRAAYNPENKVLHLLVNAKQEALDFLGF